MINPVDHTNLHLLLCPADQFDQLQQVYQPVWIMFNAGNFNESVAVRHHSALKFGILFRRLS